MWLFTKYGFYSIVRKKFKEEDKPYQVRSRESIDLENLIKRCEINEKIIHTSNSDYHYRITIDKEEFEKVMSVLSDDLDYENFKSMIHDNEDQKHKLNAYYKVWQAMYDLQGGA